MYDAQWRKLGTFLVDHNRGDSILRLGWGPNDLSHPWHADTDPTPWIACFHHVVSAIRATDPRVRIDWSFNALGASYVAPGDPYADYPGDAYVDFIGIEAYDRFPPTRTQSEWDAKCKGLTGLCTLIAFTRQHAKKLGIAEWGAVSCGDDSGGDNPFFVQKMFEIFAANTDVMGYEAYFEADTDVCSSIANGGQVPNAAAKYKELYGPR
jgi:beta-mannanase